MKNTSLLILMLLLTAFQGFGQDWKPYNDTLVYFYSASNTDEFFTLRTKTKTVMGEATIIHFADNYIPSDVDEHPYGIQLYYAQNGSILGDSMVIVSDTVWLENTVQFVNNMTLGETLSFSTTDSTNITYLSITDTLIFDTPDSVKYYQISDGMQIIQSKNFGFVRYPKQNSDSLIFYDLVGIDNYVGLNFDHHNEIFDFEIGDKLYYSNSFFSVFYDIWDNNYSKMVVLDKYEIDGRYYYDVTIDGGFVSNYPRTILGDPAYDYPGERVEYCRACDRISSLPFGYLIGEDLEYFRNIGHRYVISPESGNILQVVGHGDVKDSYALFGTTMKIALNTSKNYYPYPYDEDELLRATYEQGYEAIYEEGFGMVHFGGGLGEMGHSRNLVGAIKSGDTLGLVNLSLYEEQMNQFNLFPNPSTEMITFDQELSKITIFDISGKQVLYVEEMTGKVIINDLESGLYVIRGTTLMGDQRVARFVKR